MDVLRFTTDQAALLFVSGIVAGGFGVAAVWLQDRWRKRPGPGESWAAAYCVIVTVALLGLSIAFIVIHNPVAGGG